MATRPVLQVEGARRLRQTLEQAGLDVQDLKDAHAAVARTVEQRARPATPQRTGALAGSLRSSGTKGAAVVRAGRARVPYAGPIHWGWPRRHITAQPWIYEAAQQTEPVWQDTYLTAIQAIVDTIEGTPGP